MELSKLAKELKPSATLAITAKAKETKANGIDVIGYIISSPNEILLSTAQLAFA